MYSICSVVIAQNDFFLCLDKRGNKEYKVYKMNESIPEGCTNFPPVTKPPVSTAANENVRNLAGFDTKEFCHKLGAAAGGNNQIETGCREHEEKAQNHIALMPVPSRIAKHCQEEGRALGGSYQIMEDCIEKELKEK